MDNSFTEHVMERARERQRKLGPLRETHFVSASHPNVSRIEEVKSRKEVVSDSILLSPKLTKSNSSTKISSNITSSPCGQEINTLKIQKDSLNMNICFSSSENVRVEVEIHSDDENMPVAKVHAAPTISEESANDSDSIDANSGLREKAKTRLDKLGKLYSGSGDLSSPISKNEAKYNKVDKTQNETVLEGKENNRPRKGLSKLADLAKDINEWEDDISTSRKPVQEKKPSTPKKWKPPAPQPPKVESPKSKTISHGKPQAPKPPVQQNVVPQDKAKSSKTIKWDKSVLDTLESQGFTRTSSSSRLVYNFNDSQEKKQSESVAEEDEREEELPVVTKKFEPLIAKKETNLVTPRSPVKNRGAVASRAAMFEANKAIPSSPKKETDPACLSVSQRKALFEKNKGDALLPKAAFGMSAPITKIQPSSNSEGPKKPEVSKAPESASIAEKIALLNQCANETTISQKQIENKVKSDRQKDMEVLLNRFNRNKQAVSKQQDIIEEVDNSSDSDNPDEASETTAMITTKPAKVCASQAGSERKPAEKRSQPGNNPQVQAVLDDVKRIKVTQPKDGKLYPSLSDIEATTETEPEGTISANNSSLDESIVESDNGDNSTLSQEVMGAVYNRNQKRTSNYSTDSTVSDVLGDINQYLNEFDTDSPGPTPPKHSKILSPVRSQPSQSFTYKKFSPQKSPSKFRSPCKIVTSPRKDTGNLPTHVVDGADVLPLTYTVSFYRKQQTQGSTPVRQVIRQPLVEKINDDDGSSKQNLEIQNKIEHLTKEINKQQMVISQASSALNLCISTSEFTGSTEQVEAEKLLLLASHRRQAALLEIQRLKVEQSLRPLKQNAQNIPVEKGTITISNITFPLKKEYAKALAAAGGKGHHVVCLIKCGEDIVDTPLVSTVAPSSKNTDIELKIPGKVVLDNVYSDFAITLEVYCLQAQEEILPHEVKYRIGKKGGSKLTPRKGKQDNRMIRPPKESPAGPQAVRTSSFALNGYVIFSIHAINKTQWTLNQTPPISPLEGSINMCVQCELNVSINHHGFLNMFEDVSGLGAWHRRWCLLQERVISYWKYPEDERKKPPIDTIDLKSCITKTVGPVSRDICARLHTFLLERERRVQPHDKETLTVSCRGDKTIIKHLLSADTKEERIEWCDNLNKALAAMRMCAGEIKSTDF